MKKKQNLWPTFYGGLGKMINVMRLTILILLISLSPAIAVDSYSQQAKLSMNMSGATVEKIIDEIEKSTDFFFLYNKGRIDVERKVDLQVHDESIKEVLDRLFAGTDISYSIKDRQILLMNNRLSESENDFFAQQQKAIKGKVTDTSGGPLSGVSVLVKGSNQGIITDVNGNYSLTEVSPDATLVFSFVGMKTQEIAVAGEDYIQVTLEEETIGVDEVVVIGYGTVRKKDLTGAVANTKGTDIKAQGVSDMTRALQGLMPGVSIESAGGDPGSGTRILIRGVSSLGNASPLYIVDGVQVDNINNLSSADIASIDVLKDASAAAIYGSRAANGVVLVTTNSGKAGKPAMQFTASYGLQKIINEADVLNAQEWATVSNAAHDAAGLPRLAIAANPESLGAGTEWQEAIYRTAPVQQYSLLASGGNDNSNYSVSGSYNNQKGIVETTGYRRYNIRVKSQTTIGRFKFGETIMATREKWQKMAGGWGGQGGNPVGSAAKMISMFQIYDENAIGGFAGAYGPVTNIANPLAQLHLEDISNELTTLLMNAFGEVTIIPGLSYKLNLGYTRDFGTDIDYTMRHQVGTLFNQQTNDISQSKDENLLVLLENTLNFSRVIGKHNIQALAGYTYQNRKYSYLTASRTDLPDGIRSLDAGAGTSSNGGNQSESALVSVLGRVIYSFDDRYLLTTSFRRDGSSRFGSANRYGNFPSVALGWNLSGEDFFAPLLNTIPYLKLRASYGVLGNQEIGDYQYSAVVSSNINSVIGAEQQKWFGSIQTAFTSPLIKWENTETLNFGLDAALLDSKLNVNADYFTKKTKDVLLNVPIPGSAGSVSNPVVNAGTLRNRGFEFGFNYNDKLGKLEYDIYGTLSALKNKVIELGTGTQQIFGGQPTHHGESTTVTQAGGPVSGFFLIKALDIFDSQEEITSYSKEGTLIQPNAEPGDIKFLDANDDGRINDQDRVFSGSPFPKFDYGLGIRLAYAGFDLNVFFQGTQGNKIYNGLRQDLEGMNLEFNYSKATLDAWTATNHSNIPRAVINDPNYNTRTSTRFLEDGSYLRLKTLQIGYTFDDYLVKKLNMTSLRAFISADNLFTITDYSGFNPDIGRTGSIYDRGVDYGHIAYPLAKTISFGFQLSL
jgi:TonB-linked SusC/RagA family outer membrane protein